MGLSRAVALSRSFAGPPFAAALALIAAMAISPRPGEAAPATAAGTPTTSAAAPGAWTADAPTADAPAAAAPAADPAIAGGAAPNAATPAEDIRDIRGPKTVFPLWLLAALLAGLALLVIAGYAAWRWLRRRQQPRPLTPLEIILQRLEATRALMHPSTVREFSIAISDIVRGYIEYAFDVTATQRTTEEFLRDLLGSSNAALAKHRGLLEEFLHRCDVAKFAGVALSAKIMESLYQSAHRFVIETSKRAADSTPDLPPSSMKEAHGSLPSA